MYKKIIEQMEKNICRILIGKNQGTGFFCKIPYLNNDEMLPVLVTNNHIINKDLFIILKKCYNKIGYKRGRNF